MPHTDALMNQVHSKAVFLLLQELAVFGTSHLHGWDRGRSIFPILVTDKPHSPANKPSNQRSQPTHQADRQLGQDHQTARWTGLRCISWHGAYHSTSSAVRDTNQAFASQEPTFLSLWQMSSQQAMVFNHRFIDCIVCRS